MTQSIYLCYKSQPQLGARVVNGIVTAIVNSATGPKALLNAALAANQSLIPTTSTDDSEADFDQVVDQLFPPAYFDTAVIISSSGGIPGSGNLSANGDAYIVQAPAAAPQFVAGSAYTPVV